MIAPLLTDFIMGVIFTFSVQFVFLHIFVYICLFSFISHPFLSFFFLFSSLPLSFSFTSPFQHVMLYRIRSLWLLFIYHQCTIGVSLCQSVSMRRHKSAYLQKLKFKVGLIECIHISLLHLYCYI